MQIRQYTYRFPPWMAPQMLILCIPKIQPILRRRLLLRGPHLKNRWGYKWLRRLRIIFILFNPCYTSYIKTYIMYIDDYNKRKCYEVVVVDVMVSIYLYLGYYLAYPRKNDIRVITDRRASRTCSIIGIRILRIQLTYPPYLARAHV